MKETKERANFASISEKREDIEPTAIDEIFYLTFPTAAAFAFSLIVPFILRSVIEEKEEHMKSLMIIMGLKKSVYW